MTTADTQLMILSSQIQEISKIEGLVSKLFEEYEINPDYYGNVLVALTEAANNAILHGNSCNPSKKVLIAYNRDNGFLYFDIKDEGTGFNPEDLPDPTDPKNIDKPNGRGVFLMKKLADKVEFMDNGTHVRLGFSVS